MPISMQNDPSKERQAPVLLPNDIDVFGVIEKCEAKTLTFKKGSSSGRTATIFDVAFRVLGGEFAGAKIYDSLFMNIEVHEDMGAYTTYQFGDCRKFFSLLSTIGAEVMVEGMDTPAYMIPCNENDIEQLIYGTGPYDKCRSILGTLMCIRTGSREKPRWANGGPVKGADGKDVCDTITTIANVSRPTIEMQTELNGAMKDWFDSHGARRVFLPVPDDDDIPF